MEFIGDYLLIGAATIVIAGLMQGAFYALNGVFRVKHENAQRRREAELFELRVAMARKQRAADVQQSFAWGGWRKFEVERKEIEDSNREICSFYLTPHDAKPIPAYKPGQYLTFQLKIPGRSKSVARCYSLSDSPKSDHYRITVKRVGPPPAQPDAPPGLSSSFFHDEIEVGDILDVSTPKGNFFLDLFGDAPVVLIGGGVGITPVLSMLNAIIESGANRETWFFYGVRYRREHIMEEHVKNVAREHANVHVHVCYSDPTDEDESGADYQHAERISVDLLKRLLPSNNYHFYLCGPPPMMNSLTEGLRDWGIPSEDIHLEKFGPASVSKTKKKPDPDASGPEITFRRSEKIVKWDPQTQHLWDFAKAHDVEIESGCLEGDCGTCQTAILLGEVEYTKRPGFDFEEGTCLPCCCVPKGPLVLDA